MQFWSPKRYSLALRGWFGVLYFIFTSLWFFFQFCMQLQRAPDDTLWCWEVDWRGLFPPSEKDQSALRFKIKMAPAWKSSCTIWTTELHNSFHPTIRDGSTWSKFGARGEHGDVFLFSNLAALWFSENLIRYSLHVCLREVKNNLFPFKHSYLRHFSWRF